MIKKSTLTSLTPLVETAVYTVPQGKKSELVMIWISNPSANNRKITLKAYNSSADMSISILEDFAIALHELKQIGGTENTFVMMEEGDKILATGSTGSTFSVVCAVKEYNDIIQGG